MTRPFDDTTRKQARVLCYRTEPSDLGQVIAYRPAKPASRIWEELCSTYTQSFGGRKDVQPPYRALEAVLRAVIGTWARWQWNNGQCELLAGREISPEDRHDVFLYWTEAVIPGPAGAEIGKRLAELVAHATPVEAEVPPPPRGGRRARSWWPGELARWRLAEHLASLDWPLGAEHPVRFTLCSDGTLAALGHELTGAADAAGRVRHLLARIIIGTAATGHSGRHALTVNAAATLLATAWKGVSTVLLANPDQPIVVAAKTDGPPWQRRLNVPAVAASRRLAALPRLTTKIPPFPEHLDDTALTESHLGPVWAVAPISTKTSGLGRGHGMDFYRRLEKLLDDKGETYSHRSPLFLEVPGIALPPTETGARVHGPITADRIPAALDTAGINTLLVVVLWDTDEVRSRLQSEIARQWGFGPEFVAAEATEYPTLGGRLKVVFLQDKPGALRHGPQTAQTRQQHLENLLAPFTGPDTHTAVICETDWDPNRWYPTIEARKKAEAEDAKPPSKQALAKIGATAQYIKQAPPPVPTHRKDGTPYNEKYRADLVATRQAGLDKSTENTLREILRGVGASDHRLGAAFGKLPLRPWWHIGIHVRRHAPRRPYGKRRTATPAPLTITLAAIRPTGGPDDPWHVWAYSPQAGRWMTYGPANTALHATDLAWDVTPYTAIGNETQQASAAAQLVESALVSARSQLPPPAPTVVYVDSDATEYIWAGLADESLGQTPPSDLPRPSSWLPGHSLPRAQRPLATVRVISNLERIGRPTGAYMRTKDGSWRSTDTTNGLYQLANDDATHLYPDFMLVNVPRPYSASVSGRFGKDETRFASSRQSKNGYAHTATRFTVIEQSEGAELDLIGTGAAVLTNQGISWDARQAEPTPLRLARKMDADHPYHRRTTETDDEPDGLPADGGTAENP
ncbi:RNAseH domain-containing protein [Kitasatospora sp. NPDC101155]|uniref:RNAseH domain-containing protein n=1 Tax=Kitasatospora sp. NPDC101155 TaxID=3364097 RepID=UPI00380AC333